MPVVVESAAYYAAANTCYKLSTDVQAAFKPLSRVLTLKPAEWPAAIKPSKPGLRDMTIVPRLSPRRAPNMHERYSAWATS